MRNKNPAGSPRRARLGFTLLEALIAATIFALVSTIGAAIFINISQSERKTELSNALYEDARIIMEMLSREIRAGTIDYEEYYSINVADAKYYGINRGVYGSRFYDPGYYLKDDGTVAVGTNPTHLGVHIDQGVIYSLSVDKNTGKNPYQAPGKATAFCDDLVPGKVCPDPAPAQIPAQDELYLISSDGRSKTIFVSQQIKTNDYAISTLKLEGSDFDNNGTIDLFTCSENSLDYTDCKKESTVPAEDFHFPVTVSFDDDDKLALKHDPTKQFSLQTSAFAPISPLRSSIKDLQFIIWPDEDPYKAFAEKDVQYQPNVTIVMTLEPSEEEKADYPSDKIPEITIQTTVSTGVHQKLSTYPPTSDLDWIGDVL
jgi:type II secretory pathway pseudopilin PulG